MHNKKNNTEKISENEKHIQDTIKSNYNQYYIIVGVIILLSLFFLTQMKHMNILILIVMLIILVYIIINYNIHTMNITEGFDNDEKLYDSQSAHSYYTKYFNNSKNIMCAMTYTHSHTPTSIFTKLADLSNNNNLISILLNTDKKTAMQQNSQLESFYSINLGNSSVFIEPSTVQPNVMTNFNQNNFTISWNMLFDNKLFNLEEMKDKLPNEYNKYKNNGIFKYEIFSIRNYYSPSDSIHIPYYLKCNYCIRKLQDNAILKYMEIQLDDDSILNENDDAALYKILYDTWSRRYSKFNMIIYDTLNDVFDNVDNSYYGFMSDNKEHIFSLVRNNNKLSLYINNTEIKDSVINDLHLINSEFTINSNGKIEEMSDDKDSISFFNNMTTFNTKNKNPGMFINEKQMLANSSSYLTYICISSTNLSTSEIMNINSGIQTLSQKYTLLSKSLIQNHLQYFKNIQNKNHKLESQLQEINLKKTVCSLNNPELCNICSNNTITDWTNMTNIIENAGSKACLTGIIEHCYNNSYDEACPFDKKILDTLNSTIHKEQINISTAEVNNDEKSTVAPDSNDDASISGNNDSSNDDKTNDTTEAFVKSNNKKKSSNKVKKPNKMDMDLYNDMINENLIKRLANSV